MKVKIHKFCIPTTSSVGTSKYKSFVAKADYDRAMKRIKELTEIINRLDGLDYGNTNIIIV